MGGDFFRYKVLGERSLLLSDKAAEMAEDTRAEATESDDREGLVREFLNRKSMRTGIRSHRKIASSCKTMSLLKVSTSASMSATPRYGRSASADLSARYRAGTATI